MDASITLCHFAIVQDGLLNIIGGGYRVLGPDPQPYFVAIDVSVSWSEANTLHKFVLELVDEDGHVVLDPNGNPLYAGRGEFETSPQTGLRHGTELGFPLAAPVPPLPLEPGKSYTWRFSIDGQPEWVWSRTVHVRRQLTHLRPTN